MKESMLKALKLEKGITLIALVITIVILIILATVTINAVFGENGLITKAQYAAFISEMNSVKEKVDIWMTSNEIDVILDEGTTGIPENGLCQSSTLDETERLKGEIGYYRTWQTTNTMPAMDIKTNAEEFNSAFSGELVAFPSGIQDLYYLNNEELGLSKNKTYLMDISTGMIYSVKGIEIEGVMAYSVNMAQALMTGINNMPNFSQTEAGRTDEILAGNPDAENGFQIIADDSSNNIFKLYNNGDLYGKGAKGIQLNSSEAEMEEINDKVWQTFEVPSTIPGASTNNIEIYPGYNTVYVKDSEGYLWAWGDNTNNKLGLTQSQQVEYTGMEPVKLNVDGKKVKTVYPGNKLTYIITQNNEVYAAGYNANGALGLGSKTTQVDEFTKVNVNNIENIYKIMPNDWMTLIWYKDSSGNNEFYATGTNRQGWMLSTGSSTEDYLANFTKIYDGNIGTDIDSEIKDILWSSASVMILKNNGTIWQTGYTLRDGSGGGGDISNASSIYIFKQFPENFGTNVSGIYQVGNGRLITRINDIGEVEVWGTPGLNNNLGITDSNAEGSNKYWQIPIPEDLKQKEIKEIFTTSNNVYYLSNTGKVYVSGNAVTSGLNLMSGKTTGIVYSGLDNIQTMYSTEIVKIIDSNTYSVQNPLCFTGNDGKIYTTGNSKIVFRDRTLQKEWKLVASNVKSFDAKNTAYIDNNNNLYIAGNNSDILGLGENSQNINNYILHPDESIRGKVKEIKMTNTNTYILTTEGELLGTGYYENGGTLCYPGWSEVENKTTFVKILDNIKVFSINNNKFSTGIAISNDGQAYMWGRNYGGSNGQATTYKIPTEYNLKLQVEDCDSTKKIITSDLRSFLLTEEGNLYKSGNYSTNNPVYDGGFTPTNYFSKYTYNMNLNEGENIIDVVGNSENMLALTSVGRLFGYGYANQLGINDVSTTLTETMEIPGMTDVVQIAKGNGFYIAVKSDGTVWGTGTNQYGVLGRWVGSDRNSPNSRYRTAYEWVECPELEI